MPEDYSWTANTLSEAGAQGVEGAWLARSGFLLFGGAALLAVTVLVGAWPRVAQWSHGAFALLLIASAVFSTRPWRPGVAFDGTEDALHSVAATTMGFAFALGVVAVLGLRPRAEGLLRRVVGVAAVAASVVLPLGMTVAPSAQGALQRGMFLVAYGWFATELLTAPDE